MWRAAYLKDVKQPVTIAVERDKGCVMSDKGGDTILRVTNEILEEEYPKLAVKCKVTLPDEKMGRVGQAVAAASLPVSQK